jgi:hypothetical protein
MFKLLPEDMQEFLMREALESNSEEGRIGVAS